MKELDFNNIVDSIASVEKVEISKADHLQNFNMLSSGINFYNDIARQQYLGLINPGIHLPEVISKLKKLSGVVDPNDSSWYEPADIADGIVRFCELNRTEPIMAYRVPGMNVLYGCVSNQHTFVKDKDVVDIKKAFFENIPHNTVYNHSIYRMKMDLNFPEISIPLVGDNAIQFRISIGNSQFGVGSLFVEAGSYEQVCTNGAMGWASKFSFRATHRRMSAEYLLRQLRDGINKIFAGATQYMTILRQANEIVDPIIKENESVVRVLRSKKFGLLKREAESIYRRIRMNPQYQRLNAFDIGRAIAEEARDTSSIDRLIELEHLAGRTMCSQVTI